MRQSSRRWLAGVVLTLALVVGGLSRPSHAQSPGPGASPPRAVSPSGAGGLTASGGGPPPPTLQPGLPAARPTGNEVQRQDGLLRLVRNVPGDAKPILLDADQITSWNEGGLVVFLLSGRVLVQQSVVQARFDQGVAWVDMKRYQATGILHLDLYAEGRVWVDASSQIQEGQRAAFDLNTRGEFRVRVAKGKMQRQDRGSEAVVARARILGVGPRRPPAVPGQPPPPSPGRPSVGDRRQPPGDDDLPRSGDVRQASLGQPKRGPGGPASSDLRLVQATAPGPAASAIPDGPPDSVPPPGPPDPLPRPGTSPPVRDPGGPAPPISLGSPSIPPPPGPPPGPEPTPGVLPPATPETPPGAPLPPPTRASEPPRPDALPPRSTPGAPLEHRVLPRSGKKPDVKFEQKQADGRQVIIVSGGLILNVRNVPRVGTLDVEADRAVIWIKDNQDPEKVARSLQGDGSANELEFYMAGHVILRGAFNGRDRLVMEADELFYDARRNVALALQSRVELRTQRFNTRTVSLSEPVIITTPRLVQTGANTFEVSEAEIFSSRLSSDPGLKLLVARATVTNDTRQETNLFGRPVTDAKGQPVTVAENVIVARNVFAELEGVPFFYTPYLKTDANDPMGPLQSIALGENRVLGFTAGVGLDVYKLFGQQPIEGTRWRLNLDYLSRRGLAVGSNFDYSGVWKSLLHNLGGEDILPKYEGSVRLYGLHDDGTDILGGSRPYDTFQPPGYRGRAFWRQSVYDLPYGFDVHSQLSLLSDRNFLEQYFKREFDTDLNQANFLYVKQQQDNWAWSAMGQVQTSKWITTTQWLPRLDGYLIGQPLFDLFTSNTRVGGAYAELRPSSDPPQGLAGVPGGPGPAVTPDATTRRDGTGRFYAMEELALPLDLGAFKVVPYARGALVDYTHDLAGDELLRAWGGLGLRASVPLTRLYPDVQSELFNLNAINHKIVMTGNYFYARANEPYTKVPQLDRLNDDATESMLREFKPQEPVFNPQAGVALATSPLFDPQQYAIRRLVWNRIDTLDSIDVLQLDVRQRLQTKRGYPGAEHIVDWMTLDTSVSLFPETGQNYGKSFSFAEYQYTWNIGDRTTFESTGWYDPQDQGARVYTVGMYFNRPDRTSFYVGYRQIDPLQSRAITGSVSYVFSPKYAVTVASSYDLGTSGALTNSLIFTRTGTDLQVSLGFSYNSLQNNFGAIVEVVPSLVPNIRRGGSSVSGLFSR